MARGKSDDKPTQKEMVQAALDDKGWKVKAVELQGFINEKYGVELRTSLISNYKSIIKREGGKRGGRKPGRKGGVQFSDLETVRGLVERLGADQVKKLVDVAGMFA